MDNKTKNNLSLFLSGFLTKKTIENNIDNIKKHGKYDIDEIDIFGFSKECDFFAFIKSLPTTEYFKLYPENASEHIVKSLKIVNNKKFEFPIINYFIDLFEKSIKNYAIVGIENESYNKFIVCVQELLNSIYQTILRNFNDVYFNYKGIQSIKDNFIKNGVECFSQDTIIYSIDDPELIKTKEPIRSSIGKYSKKEILEAFEVIEKSFIGNYYFEEENYPIGVEKNISIIDANLEEYLLKK